MISTREAGLPLSSRLRQHSEFDAVFKQDSIRLNTRDFLILARQNDFTCGRLGMIISKKNTPSAVKRNLIKRLVRESFRHARQHETPLDIVVISRSTANTMSGRQLRSGLDKLFSQLSDNGC